MNSTLKIPTLCKVGFNLREDTYTGKLGYVIYKEGKVWRKETSFLGWRTEYLEPEEYDARKLKAFNDRIEYVTNQFNWYVEEIKKNKDNNKYYSQYVNGGLEAYLKKQNCDNLEDFVFEHPYVNNVSKDETIKVVEFENVPTEGFVLNKKAGGGSRGYDGRDTYCRVYDPRGFEFEIDIENLLFILQECDSMKGKGLEGSFVYSWHGKNLVLLPTNSIEYTSSQKFTKLLTEKVGAKNMVEGCSYINAKSEPFIYLGRFNVSNVGYDKERVSFSKEYVFVNNKNEFHFSKNISFLKQKISDDQVSNYNDLLDKFNQSEHGLRIENYTERKVSFQSNSEFSRSPYQGSYYLKQKDGTYHSIMISTNLVQGNYFSRNKTNKISSVNISFNKIISSNKGEIVIKPIKKNTLCKVNEEDFNKLDVIAIDFTSRNKTYKLNV